MDDSVEWIDLQEHPCGPFFFGRSEPHWTERDHSVHPQYSQKSRSLILYMFDIIAIHACTAMGFRPLGGHEIPPALQGEFRRLSSRLWGESKYLQRYAKKQFKSISRVQIFTALRQQKVQVQF